MEGKPLLLQSPEMVIQSDAALTGGGELQRWVSPTGGMWTEKEKLLHINVLELLAIKTFTKQRKVIINSPSVGQHCSTILPVENGGHKKQNINKNIEGNLALSIARGDHSYCRMDTKQAKHSSRLGIQECEGLFRMDTEAPHFPKCMQVYEGEAKQIFLHQEQPIS